MKKKIFTLIEILFCIVLFFVPFLFIVSLFHPDLNIKKTYNVSFEDVNGIITGTPINFAGHNVGYVKKLKINGNKVDAKLAIITKEFEMPECAVIKIEETGLGGSRSLEIYSCDNTDMPNGIYTVKPKKINDILEDANVFSKNLVEGMGNMYLGLNASYGGKTHEDFVKLQDKLQSNKKDLNKMSVDLVNSKTKIKENLPKMNINLEKNIDYFSKIDINPEEIKFKAKRNQKAIKNMEKTLNKYTPQQYKFMAQTLYKETEILKYINLRKIYKNLDEINEIMDSTQNILHSIKNNFESEQLEKTSKTMENIRKDTENLIKEDF